MGEGELTAREQALREDLRTEYYALSDTVSGFDGRLLIVKGCRSRSRWPRSGSASSSSTTRCSRWEQRRRSGSGSSTR